MAADRRALLIAALIAGCSAPASDDGGMPDGGIGSGAAGDLAGSCALFDAGALDPALVAAGMALVQANNCQQCHGANLSGNYDGVAFPGHDWRAYPPNLTPDPDTGLGCWSTDQIVNAILNNVDDEGAPICPPMLHFSSYGLGSADAIAIVTFLRSLPPSVNQVPETPSCAPFGQEGGGCVGDSDCASGDVCSYQLCVSAASLDLAAPPDLAEPGDGGEAPPDLRHPPRDFGPPPDFATNGNACTTASVSIGVSPTPAIGFANVQLTAQAVGHGGCTPAEQGWRWSFVSVPAGSKSAFDSTSVANPSFVPDVAQATWRVHLTYTNSDSGQIFDVESDVTTNYCFSSPPVARIQTLLPSVSPPFGEDAPLGAPSDAGAFGAPDLVFATGTGVQLSGGPSSDPSASLGCGPIPPLGYGWTLVIEPPGSSAKLSMSSGLATNLVLDVPGRYVIGLTASDGIVTSSPAYLRIDAQ